MEALLFLRLVLGLLMFAGVVISARLSTQGALGTGRFRRIRRMRSRRPKPGGAVMAETVEAFIDEEVPVEMTPDRAREPGCVPMRGKTARNQQESTKSLLRHLSYPHALKSRRGFPHPRGVCCLKPPSLTGLLPPIPQARNVSAVAP